MVDREDGEHRRADRAQRRDGDLGYQRLGGRQRLQQRARHQRAEDITNKAVIEHWNGAAWSIVASPAGLISVDRISAARGTDIWASGQAPLQTIAGVPVPVARTLHWNGTAWSAMPGPTGSDPNTEVTGLSALPIGVRPGRPAPPFSATAAAAFIAHHTP